MITMSVGEFKAQFSNVIEKVKNGEQIQVTFGKKKQVIGYFKPEEITLKKYRKVGIYDNMNGYFMSDDFCETTDEEFPINDFPL